MSSLNRDYVTFSNHKTTCPWKGTASYYSLLVNGELNTDAAWYYADPKPEAEMVKGPRRLLEGREGRRREQRRSCDARAVHTARSTRSPHCARTAMPC